MIDPWHMIKIVSISPKNPSQSHTCLVFQMCFSQFQFHLITVVFCYYYKQVESSCSQAQVTGCTLSKLQIHKGSVKAFCTVTVYDDILHNLKARFEDGLVYGISVKVVTQISIEEFIVYPNKKGV